MTIKISQLANLAVAQGNAIVPIVSNITGIYTTYSANIDVLQTYIISGVLTSIAGLTNNAATQSDLIIGINANISTSNTGMKGYVDSTVTSNISTVNSSIITANIGMKGYVDDATTSSNIGMKGYVDTVVTANVNSYSNINVTSYLPTHSGSIGGILTNTAQINITSVGNLANLTVLGNITTLGYYQGDIGYVSGVSTAIFRAGDVYFDGNLGLDGGIPYVPTANNSPGLKGQVTYDSDYVYVCVATDTWKRANISTW